MIGQPRPGASNVKGDAYASGAPAADEVALRDGSRIFVFADEGYGPVVDRFVANFEEHCEVGAACTVYLSGRSVVDMWGGVADAETGRAWTRDTSAVIFSCGKGLLAICAYLLAAEIPGANAISTAASLARVYAACMTEVGGLRLLSDASLEDALRVQSGGPQVTGAPDDGARWGTGFQVSSPPSQPMLGRASLGHAGAGGQLAFGDAEYLVGFAYLCNQMGGFGDVRAREMTAALGAVLGG